MKILLWITKEEAISGNITWYSTQKPTSIDMSKYVQVSLTHLEFMKLEDAEPSEEPIYKYNYNPNTGLAFRKDITDNNTPAQQVAVEEYLNVNGGDFVNYWKALDSKTKELLANKYDLKW